MIIIFESKTSQIVARSTNRMGKHLLPMVRVGITAGMVIATILVPSTEGRLEERLDLLLVMETIRVTVGVTIPTITVLVTMVIEVIVTVVIIKSRQTHSLRNKHGARERTTTTAVSNT